MSALPLTMLAYARDFLIYLMFLPTAGFYSHPDSSRRDAFHHSGHEARRFPKLFCLVYALRAGAGDERHRTVS